MAKFSSSLKKPLPDWESYICRPRKFFSEFIFLVLGILLIILFVNIEDSYIYFLTILLHRSILSNHLHVLLLPDNFSVAKCQLSYFCETSTTELENSDICKPRKRIPKRNYDSISEIENNEYTQHSKTKNRGKS